MTRWQSLIRFPRRPSPRTRAVCARVWSSPVPWSGHEEPRDRSTPTTSSTRARFLHEAYALTGDAPAARAAVRDAFVVAWHHWRKVSVLDDPDAYVRALAHGRARRRHTARIWHRDKSLDPEVAATFEALSKLTAAQRQLLVLTHLSTLSIGRHRPHGRSRPRRRRARPADGLVAVRPAPRRAHDRHPRPAGGPGPAPRGHPLAPGHGHPAHRRRPTPYAHGGGGRARLGRAARLRLAGRLRLRRRGHQPGRRDGHARASPSTRPPRRSPTPPASR